jgi:hypothetical protein
MNQIILNSSETFVEGIRVISRPLDTDMGVKPLTPFVVSVSAETSNYDELLVDLYANNSKSIPYTSELDNNWSALKAQWRFLDVNGDEIEEQISIDFDTEVLDENNTVRGGVGTATFYYVDDLPSDCGAPVMLQCTLNTLNYYDRNFRSSEESITSFYNSKMTTTIPFQVYPIKPSFIQFSQNGAIDLYNLQWAGNNITGFATIKGIPRIQFIDYEACAVDYPTIFNSPKYESMSGTNILDYTIYPLLPTEMSPSASPSAEFLPYEMGSGIADGGWTAFELASMVESSAAMMSGNVDITYDNADYACEGTAGMWVSNRTANMIHKLETTYIDATNPSISAFYESDGDSISNNVYSTGFNVPYFEPSYYASNPELLTNVEELSGYSGVYGIAIDGEDNVWNVDFELDRIYKRDSAGGMLFTVDLQNSPSGSLPDPYADDEYSWYGPSSISLNQVGDAYVTLYNSPYTIKITSSGVIDTYFKPTAAPVSAPPASADEGTYYRPVDVEVDINNDVHVLYSNTEQSALVRFDSVGVQTGTPWDVTTEDTPFDITYVEGGSPNSPDIYATVNGSSLVDPEPGIKRYKINGSTYTAYVNNLCDATDPTYITMDTNQNIWFAFDNNKIGVIIDRLTTGQGEITDFPKTSYFEIPTNGYEGDVIGGLACDSGGFINILQTNTNVMHRQSASAFIETGVASLYGVKINPEENYTIVKEGGEIIKVPALSGEAVPSLQAYGDWTGISWDQKYGTQTVVSGSETVTLSGSSFPFQIKSFQEEYELRRFNDSWDMHEQIKSYIIPDFQQQFTDLWDDLIGNTVGNDGSTYQTFGRQFYEKIANFVINHSDIDFANIDQVYSIFSSLALQYQNYDFNYPADLKHWMNILSIVFERLRGEQYQCNRNFKPQRYEDVEECEVCGQIHPSNMGDLIVSPTMVVGEPVVLRDTYLSTNAFDIFYPPLSGDYQQLSDYYGYRTPFGINYEIFEYIPTVSSNNQAEGFINWIDPHNELAISGVSSEDWWEDGGYVEQIFTQILYGGLGLGAEFYTTEQALSAFDVNIIGDLDYTNTSFMTSGSATSAYLIPIKSVPCSPIAGYGLPFYSTVETLSGPAIPLGYETSPIVSGLAVSDKYVKIIIETDIYYAPSYIIDPVALPVVGTGISFEDGFVTPEYTLNSAGFLVFSKEGDKILLPVFK